MQPHIFSRFLVMEGIPEQRAAVRVLVLQIIWISERGCLSLVACGDGSASATPREAEHGAGLEPFTRAQDRRRKTLVVRGIGKMLGLEAHPRAKCVDVPAFSLDRAVEKVAGIELHAGLGRADI